MSFGKIGFIRLSFLSDIISSFKFQTAFIKFMGRVINFNPSNLNGVKALEKYSQTSRKNRRKKRGVYLTCCYSTALWRR